MMEFWCWLQLSPPAVVGFHGLTEATVFIVVVVLIFSPKIKALDILPASAMEKVLSGFSLNSQFALSGFPGAKACKSL